MSDEIADTPEDGTSPAPKDLRAELVAKLKSEFTANLSEKAVLPKVVCDALVALLDASAPMSTDVVAALSLDDQAHPETSNE